MRGLDRSNGAGKTTLMSRLIGDRRMQTGSILLAGKKSTALENKERVAVLQQTNAIPKDLKVQELLAFFQSISANPLSSQEINDLLGFSKEQKEQLAGQLSGGQKRFLAFVLGLIDKPRLLFLDEPTASMDTETRHRFWRVINQLKTSGVTIFYTSHYIEEVEHTADRILVLHQGRLLRDTTPFAMEQEKQVTLPKQFAKQVELLPSIYDMTYKQDRVTFKTQEMDTIWPLLQEKGCRLADIELHNKTLLNSLFDQTQEEAL